MSSEKKTNGKRAASASSESTSSRKEQALVFSRTLRRYLAALKIEQTQLADESDISRQEISMWLGGQKRPPGWLDAGTMAAVIFGRMLRLKEDGGTIPASLRFDAAALVQEFVNAAGFKMNDAYDEQPLWKRLEDEKLRVLRVGWFPWGDFARVNNDKLPASAPGNFGGLSEKLCRRLCALLGLALEPVPIEVHEMKEKLLDGAVDLLAPLIQLPARKFAFACSQRIRGLDVGLGMLVKKSVTEQKHKLLEQNYANLEQIPLGKLQVWLVEQGIADVLLPRERVGETKPVKSFEEALDAVKQDAVDSATGRIRVFMADSVSCHRAAERNKSELVQILRDCHTLPVAFGVHPNEGQFLSVVNSCLDIITDDGPEFLNPKPASLGFIEKSAST